MAAACLFPDTPLKIGAIGIGIGIGIK